MTDTAGGEKERGDSGEAVRYFAEFASSCSDVVTDVPQTTYGSKHWFKCVREKRALTMSSRHTENSASVVINKHFPY